LIRPPRGWQAINLRDLWLYRELVYFLTWRDIKVRYKQAVLGIGWAIIQPIVTMVVFTFIFNQFLDVKPDAGIPDDWYPIFAFAGLLPWQFFQGALQRASTSLVSNSNLLTKVYFPRLIIPSSAVAAGLVDFGFSFLIMIGLMIYFGVPFTLQMLWLPLFLMVALLTALAVGLWLSALNVQYRDVQHMVPFLLTIWMYVSPVVYPIDVINVSGFWKAVYALNPMVGVIQGFRWVLFGTNPPGWMFAISMTMVLLLLGSGLFYFRRMERTFADLI
ncbi:MAG: phosphate ABC transporter permease, partial [Anaerolinea sp.]|nr:phosphate ABC transporter permease [Anaerolinea sp.]